MKAKELFIQTLNNNPFHLISIKGQSHMPNASSVITINNEDGNLESKGFPQLEYFFQKPCLWIYTYDSAKSLETDLMDLLEKPKSLDTYFDYLIDEVDMLLYGATLIFEQGKFRPLIKKKIIKDLGIIKEKLTDYPDDSRNSNLIEPIEYYYSLFQAEDFYKHMGYVIIALRDFTKP